MKLTKRMIAGALIVGLLVSLSLPGIAEAGGRRWHHGGGHRGHHHHSAGHFWGGVAAGTLTGFVVGSIFAPRVFAAPPVVVQPAPVVVQPVCTSQWVPTYWNGVQWVPGYWAQVCR